VCVQRHLPNRRRSDGWRIIGGVNSDGGSPAQLCTGCSPWVACGVRGSRGRDAAGGPPLPGDWGFSRVFSRVGIGIPGGSVGWSGGGGRSRMGVGRTPRIPRWVPAPDPSPGSSLSVSLSHSNDGDNESTVSECPRKPPPARRWPPFAGGRESRTSARTNPTACLPPPRGRKEPISTAVRPYIQSVIDELFLHRAPQAPMTWSKFFLMNAAHVTKAPISRNT
jgi:hypothetical protein